MIKFSTVWGQEIKITSAIDQDEFQEAMDSQNPNARFHVGNTFYFVRCVGSWIECRKLGPHLRRERFSFVNKA